MKKTIIAGAVSLLPVLAFAQNQGFQSIGSSIDSLSRLLNQLIPLVIGIAVLLFLIGILQYITAGGDEEKRAAARGMIIFGIIALFVMTAVWGFVRILGNTFFGGQNLTAPPSTPGVPLSNTVNR